MAIYKLSRFSIRPESRLDAERAMHAHASYVRETLADVAWTTYRERGDSGQYLALTRIDGVASSADAPPDGGPELVTAMRAFLTSEIVDGEYELVTSSDLARRMDANRRGGLASRARRRSSR